MKLHLIDLSIIALYLIFCLALGLKKFSSVKNIRDYTLGDAMIPSTTLMATLFATYIGAGSTVGNIEKIHSMGLIFALAMAFSPLIWLTTAKIFANHIEYFKRQGCMSISDVMGVLYGNYARWFTSVMYLVMSIGILAMQVTAIGYLLHYFLGISKLVGILIGFGALTLYSTLGGIRAVVATDVFQSLILFIGIPAACFAAYFDIGGYSALISKLPATHTTVDWSNANLALFLSLIVYFIIPVSSGSYIQRFLMAGDSKQLKKALYSNALISIPFVLIICMVGFIVKAKAPDINSNTAFFYLIDNHLPPVIVGLVIAGILAAIMSTADSWLNTASVLVAHDIIKALFPKISDKRELLIARLSVIGLGALATFLAVSENKSILGLEWLVSNFWEPLVLVPIALGFLKLRNNPKSFGFGILVGISSVLAGRYITGEFATLSLLAGIIGTSTSMVIAHYAQGLHLDYDANKQIKKLSSLKSALLSIQKSLKKEGQRYSNNYYHMGIFGLAYFMICAISYDATAVDYHGALLMTLRLIALALCFGLCMHDVYTSKRLQAKYMTIYWYVTIAYCLPFISGYMMISSSFDSHWVIGFLLSEFILFLFTGWIQAITISITGLTLSIALFIFSGSSIITIAAAEARIITAALSVCAIAVLYFLRKREHMNEEELESKFVYGNSIAHEMRNLLHSGLMFSSTAESIVSQKTISKEDKDDLLHMLSGFKKSMTEGSRMIDNILNAVRTDVLSAEDIGIYNIHSTLQAAIDSLKAHDAQKKLIDIKQDNNFEYFASEHFVKHVIINLISNAFKYAKGAKIEIWYEDHKLHIKDYGKGIKPESMDTLFTPFDKSGGIRGTGLGLAFCARVMEDFEGSITCSSELGKFTHFILSFAKVK